MDEKNEESEFSKVNHNRILNLRMLYVPNFRNLSVEQISKVLGIQILLIFKLTEFTVRVRRMKFPIYHSAFLGQNVDLLMFFGLNIILFQYTFEKSKIIGLKSVENKNYHTCIYLYKLLTTHNYPKSYVIINNYQMALFIKYKDRII